ncbi:MAG: hypothetical protein HPY59_12195 [Anaerolineae bacterium]|nr:hypothetical protein [Anaerolineae bacterium]
MKSKLIRYLILGTSLGMILAALSLSLIELMKFQQARNQYPNGLRIAGIPVGGVDRQEAARRVEAIYQTPIEIHYGDAIIHVTPEDLGFQLNLPAMLAAAEERQNQEAFWAQLWDYLWNRPNEIQADIPLQASIDKEQIIKYLKSEIMPRYDQPALPAQPQPESLTFTAGQNGQTFNVELAAEQIEAALRSPERRTVILSLSQLASPPPSIQHLKLMIQQTIDRAGFDGLVEIYMKPLAGQEGLHFAYQNGQNLPPDIAFTAASTIKIPIMVSIYRREDFPPPPDILQMLTLMITESKNEPADRLMEVVLDPIRGPLIVTEDMQALGFQNTFLAGYFYMGAPLLNIFETPANSRTDINLQPDIYNQTTPREMGMLLEDIYTCAESNNGPLITTFSGQIMQEECQQILDLLTQNKLPYLLTAGLPEGIKIAHKHGWIEETDGLLHTMSDAAIVYTAGGDYVLLIYMYHPDQLVFDQGNAVMAALSKVVYSFFNPAPMN